MTEQVKIRAEGRQCASTAERLLVLLGYFSAVQSEDRRPRSFFRKPEADLDILSGHPETAELPRKLSGRQRRLLALLDSRPT